MILLLVAMTVSGTAEGKLSQVWVLCQPNSFVNVRMFPKKTGEVVGRLELGDSAWTDGKRKNGFLHLVDSSFEDDGWIYSGFISRTTVKQAKNRAKIVSRGRVRARRYVNGTRRKWLENAQEVTVFGISDEWCVTSEGFIQTKFIRMEGD